MPSITLTPESAVFPGTNYPELKKDDQGRLILAFDATTDEACWWKFACPAFIGTPTLIVSYYMVSASTNSVDVDVQVEAVSDGDSIVLDGADSFDTTNLVANTTVPGTQGHPDQITVTLTNDDSMAEDDMLRIRLNRDASADDAAGDMHVVMCHLKYSS